MFTIYTGNEIVADVHIAKDFTEPYTPVDTQCVLGGAHVFNAFALAQGIARENLDGRVSVLGTVSTDRFGRNFLEIAKTLGIDVSQTHRTDEDTLIAIVQKSAHNNSFDFPNKRGNAVMATRAEHLPPLPEGNKMLVMQGLCSTLKPSGGVWLEYAGDHKDMIVVYDANIRKPVIDDVNSHRKLLETWAGRAQVMKVSDADIEEIYGHEADPEVVIKSYLDAGTSVVCMTTGSRPVVTYTARHRIENPVEAQPVVNTVGAGDNFVAGIVLGFARKSFFDAAAFKIASPESLHHVVQSGISQSARHLRLINA